VLQDKAGENIRTWGAGSDRKYTVA